MKGIVKNTLILTAITVVAGSLLGLVYEVTKEPIAAAEQKAKEEAYYTVLPAKSYILYDEFDKQDADIPLTEAGYKNDEIDEVAVAKSASGATIGYVITVTSHEGYGGDIVLSVGVSKDGTVTGMELLTISETAGLGMRANEPEFKKQFRDRQVEKFVYSKTGEKESNRIDALSGATITTNAVTNAVNAALVYFQNELYAGGGSVNE